MEKGLPDVGNDDWHNVTDAKKRKKIQDRLAQRARRQRLRATKPATLPDRDSNAVILKSTSTQTDSLDLVPWSCGSPDISFQGIMINSLDNFSPVLTPPTSSSQCSFSANMSLPYELPVPLTVFGALYLNGRILGLQACTIVAGKSAAASSDVPPSLRPTEIQMYTVHLSGIDRFPFPRMRNNMITMGALFSEEEFTHDLCVQPSFSLSAGGASWDPTAWRVEESFAAKWGFLFS